MMQTVNFEIRRVELTDVDEIAAAHLDSIRSIGASYYEPRIVSDWGARIKGRSLREGHGSRGSLFHCGC